MADTRRSIMAIKRRRRSSSVATPRKTPVALMAPLAARPSQEHEDESEWDDSQHSDTDVGPALKKIMPNPITDMPSPEMTRNTTGKRGRTTKTSKSRHKRKSHEQQEPQIPSGPELVAGAGGQGSNFPTLQQSPTPILLTATRMAPVPGLGYLFQDGHGIQMLVPYYMLPTQPRQQSFWPANYQASASHPMTSPGPSIQPYSMPVGIRVGNLQYLNSGLEQYPQFQPQPALRSTHFQTQTQPSEQGSFDESFTTASFKSRGVTPSPQSQN